MIPTGHGASVSYAGKDLPGITEPVLVLSLVPPGVDGYLRMSEVMGLTLNAHTWWRLLPASGVSWIPSCEGMTLRRMAASASSMSFRRSLTTEKSFLWGEDFSLRSK